VEALSGFTSNACVSDARGHGPVPWMPRSTTRASHRCHPGKLSVLKATSLGWMSIHGMTKHRPDVALELCWPWCSSQGNLVPWSLPWRALPHSWGSVLQTAWWTSTHHIGLDGKSQGERYCSARGEILRPPQDQQRRRRSASGCSSIKNESVGCKDDQTPS